MNSQEDIMAKQVKSTKTVKQTKPTAKVAKPAAKAVKQAKQTNAKLFKRRAAAVANGVSMIHPVAVERAENAKIWDVEGKEYLDFAGGIAVLNSGHLHPKVVSAVQEQLTKVTHTCFQVVAYEPYIELCEKINELVPGKFPKKTLLVTTGSEAVENAVKIARAATGRQGVIVFDAAYHGRTMYTLSMTGKKVPYAAGMGLMPGGVYRALFPRKLHGVSVADALASVERIFKNDAEPRDIAAIVLEPVQGEGGFYAAPKEFFKGLRDICDKHGIVLIADEVQTGAGRTGTFFAMEQMGVVPDLTTFAKSIAGGFPLAGVCGRAELVDSIPPGGLGGTYAGNPLSCAAALAVIDVFKEEKLLDRANKLGAKVKKALTAIQKKHPVLAEIRITGAMIAFELMDKKTHKPNAELVAKIVERAREKGLLLLSCGSYYNIMRILVPLTISDADLDKGLNIIAECFAELDKGKK